MSYIDNVRSLYEMNRERTLATVDTIAAMENPQDVLSWRPGPGRAHIGWQLAHVAVTEELFATERLVGTEPGMGELIERFRGGSTPDHNVPTLDEIRNVLAAGREHLLATFEQFSDDDLDKVPVGLTERGWTLRRTLQIICWHEAHHQGQVHLTLNLYKASH
ncbi:MAG: DinB family protein [Planctomycetota bacterium]|nr:DinB family protein [Planctomycetota bacterium]